jgi:UDP-N-acetylmuramate--alanine ligase
LIVPYEGFEWWAHAPYAILSHPTIETFGLSDHADWHAANVQSERGRYGFDLIHRSDSLGRIELSVYGRHNVLNALAAAALASVNDCPAEAITAGMANFRGLKRRLECIYDDGGLAIWDDYAHHPTEISTTLATIREISPHPRIFCLFQPHQASRTVRLLDELALSLQNAERVLIADIFRAREGPPRPGEVTAADLAARTRAAGQKVFGSHALPDIQEYLQQQLAPGDTLVVMGAGDIGRIGYGLVDWFREHRAAG